MRPRKALGLALKLFKACEKDGTPKTLKRCVFNRVASDHEQLGPERQKVDWLHRLKHEKYQNILWKLCTASILGTNDLELVRSNDIVGSCQVGLPKSSWSRKHWIST